MAQNRILGKHKQNIPVIPLAALRELASGSNRKDVNEWQGNVVFAESFSGMMNCSELRLMKEMVSAVRIATQIGKELKNMDEKLALNVDEACALLGICKPTFYKLLRRDDFPKVKVGRRTLIPKGALQSWLDNAAQSGKVLQW